MKISYAITVCNEHKELSRLLEFLFENKRTEDEVVVQKIMEMQLRKYGMFVKDLNLNKQ